jgi:DNA helicase-2/ATP-dependent DNA helicase PcrA
MTPNKQQLDVINHVDGPCLVTAVPGSGKTASVTERTKRMVADGVDPSGILAITFTNKAAREMRSRIAVAVGQDVASRMTIETFHALCARMIRADPQAVGLTSRFTIYDENDQERLLLGCVHKVMDTKDEDFKPSKEYLLGLIGYLEWLRNACMTEVAAAERFDLDGNQLKVVAEYFSELKKSNAIDFTGLLSETLGMLESNPDILAKYRAKFRYISVDEVQDTNIAQYKIVKLLAWEHKNLLVVGDGDQALYSWRSASPENILAFESDFGAKVLKLEKNYRSTPQILKHSQNLIERNKLRKETKLETDNPAGDEPRVIAALTDGLMAIKIAEDVSNRLSKGAKPSEIAVLYRTNYASKTIEEAFRAMGIKYVVVGGLSFWHRKEVKACLHILRLLCNQNDRISFEECCEACCRGVGPRTLALVVDQAVALKTTVMKSAREFCAGTSAGAKAMKPFMDAYLKARMMPPSEGLMHIAKSTAFWEKMAEQSTSNNDRCENILEVAGDVARHFENPGATLESYVHSVSLLSSADEDGEDGAVRLMTLHACKGLEFDFVYVSHVNDGVVPHARCIGVEDAAERARQIEEERRLLYVGMTRARKALALAFFWNRLGAPAFPSRFLHETGLPVPQQPPPLAKKGKFGKWSHKS